MFVCNMYMNLCVNKIFLLLLGNVIFIFLYVGFVLFFFCFLLVVKLLLKKLYFNLLILFLLIFFSKIFNFFCFYLVFMMICKKFFLRFRFFMCSEMMLNKFNK